MRTILGVFTALAITLGSAGVASAAETVTLTVTRGIWTCTVVFVDNDASGYPSFGDVIVSASCDRTLPSQ